jgi:transposase InsO family protein
LITYLSLFCSALRAALSSRQHLVLENLALRQQLAVLSRQSRRPRLDPSDRLFWSFLSQLWSRWQSAVVIVQPETVVRWQRTAWQRYWTWKSKRSASPGRSRIPKEVRELTRRLAGENPRWGSVRILGELRKLGYDVSAQTVRRYRQRAMRRPPAQSWQTFLRNHAPHIWATDFFTVQTLTLKTLYVFLFISHDRRQLVHLNVTPHPRAEWVWRQLIEATPWGQQPKFLIRDRDCCYGGSFNPRAARLGIEAILTPIRAPKANAVAERVIGTLRRECLDHIIIINERHLRAVLREYVTHYNDGRPHRTLGLETPTGPPPRAGPLPAGRIVARPVLGGLHHEYEWLAA